MKYMKQVLFLAIMISCFATGTITAAPQQDSTSYDEELNEKDFDALRDFLKSRRMEDVAAKKSNLIVSGDLRTEWRHMSETCCGQNLRGGEAERKGLPISRNDFDIECNLYFNCVYERSWAVAHVRYDNSAGVDDNDHPCFPKNENDITPGCDKSCFDKSIQCNGDPEGYHGSGRCGDLCLKKAFFGYTIYLDDCSRFDVEVGRRGNLYNAFESNVQFLSRFDGILFKYDSACECVADWYVHVAGFLVDERVNHFAWAVETGLSNIADSNLDFKYSLIDWEKHGTNRCHARNPKGFRFINSQFLLCYLMEPSWTDKKLRFYGAYLVNHAAHKVQVGKHRKYMNTAWYVGALIGSVRKEGDWSLEIQYQVVGAFAMPDGDSAGIGRGNTLDESVTTCSRRGNTNFKGWKGEFLYAFTDNITLDSILEHSTALDKGFGGAHTYSKFELEAIYAF